jgi:hypothetical protein
MLKTLREDIANKITSARKADFMEVEILLNKALLQHKESKQV